MHLGEVKRELVAAQHGNAECNEPEAKRNVEVGEPGGKCALEAAEHKAEEAKDGQHAERHCKANALGSVE